MAVLSFLSMLVIGAASAQTPANAKPTPTGLSYDNYRMVRTRNVFDPDRRAMTPTQTTAAPTAAPVKPSDYVALTGTLLNAGKTLAFFSGSRAEFNQVLGVDGKIADATITSITPGGVEVTRGGQKIAVAVGQTVPLDNSTAPGAPPASASASAPATASGTTTATTSTPPGGTNAKQEEIMKRMMEKRKQEGL